MKWFKHMSDASADEKLAEVLDLHGAKAYGVFWLIVEAISSQMDKTTKCEVRYSLKKWASIAHVDSRTLAKYLQTFDTVALLVLRECDNFVTIEIHKLLELRDNHTKNLQVAKQPSCKQEVEVEVEVEVEKKPLVSQNKFDDEDLRFAEWMFTKIESLPGNHKQPNFNKWANTIRLMREKDGLSLKAIGTVFNWANNDDFWSSNILSPEKLRTKFSQLSAKALRPEASNEKSGPKTFQQMKTESNKNELMGFLGDDYEQLGQGRVLQIDD